MPIRRIISVVVVIVILIVALSIGSVSFLFLELRQSQDREAALRNAGAALADASSLLSEFLFLPTQRNKRQLRLATWEVAGQIEQFQFNMNMTPRLKILLERQQALLSNVSWLLQMEDARHKEDMDKAHTELAKMEVVGQSILIFREMGGYLSEIDAEIRRETAITQMTMLGLAFAGICVISAVMAMIMVWMRRRLLVPVFTLQQAASRIAEGDFAVDTGINRADEIGELAASFDFMRNAVRRHITALADSEERYRSFVERFKGIAYRGRMDFSVEFFHGAVEEITGYTEDEFVLDGIRWDALICPEDLEGIFTGDGARLRTIPGFFYDREYRIRRKDGQIRWVHDSIQNICDETGKPVSVQGTIYDVTDRKEAEESLVRARDELENRAVDLERINRELEDFAYIASHDLKEPLRGIHNYSSFLLEDYADRLDEAGKSKLHTLMRLTQRLEMLLDDLLHYSRVGRIELVMQQTDPGELVREVLETMETMLEENNVTVTIAGDLPPVVCDRASVGEVFRNLIINAVKYNDNKVKQVDIGWRKDDGSDMVALYVRDNGIGIPDKHHDKVFKIFKRLHGRDQYGGGTGSGLTLARRIIERHDGTIRLNSEYGKGSTFVFTLPKGRKYE